MGIAWSAFFVPPYKYGVVVVCVLVNIAAGNEKARHIFINAAGFGKIAFHLFGCVAVGRQVEVGELQGRGLHRLPLAPFSCQRCNGFREALSEKLHDKINGAAALALAVAIPFVPPDCQAVVPFPAVFLSGAFQRLAL